MPHTQETSILKKREQKIRLISHHNLNLTEQHERFLLFIDELLNIKEYLHEYLTVEIRRELFRKKNRKIDEFSFQFCKSLRLVELNPIARHAISLKDF
ncbi:CLUMA_CG012719, isoform A [Clunio marinus]|uniref:CLUMA_CG012719, isoform A n=1 Tax=Clunio marinus TaxID=568069 RepID=A0A1J1IGJ5_9DIPT|nr:CLUMA_CG012719, isoform A [Clunio marinus]